MRIVTAVALLTLSLSMNAQTPAEVTDKHLHAEMAARLLKGKDCKCACLREAKTLWEARKVLRKDAALDKLGLQIENDLIANQCTTTVAGGGAPLGGTIRKPPAFGGGTGGGGLTDMTLPDFYITAGKLTADEQKKLYNELPAAVKDDWREWAASNKVIVEKIYGDELAKTLLDSAKPSSSDKYTAEALAKYMKTLDTKQTYEIDLEKIEKRRLETVKPPR